MRHLLMIIILLVTQSMWAQTATEILNKHFDDYGQDDWQTIESLQIDGRYVDKDFYGYKFKLVFKSDHKIRIDGIYKGKRYIEAHDGTLSWIIAPWKDQYKVQLMNVEEEMIIRNTFTPGSPLFQNREHLRFEGLTDMEGNMYFTFVFDEGVFKKTYYLGSEDHRLYFEKIENKFGAEKKSVLKITEKYKRHGSLLMPTAVVFESETIQKELIFDQVYVGIGASDDIFLKPKE